MADVTADDLDKLEESIRRGLGTEQGLVDILVQGENVREFVNTKAGKVIVADCTRRTVDALEQLCADGVAPGSATEVNALLAVRLNIAILRRMAALVAASQMAAEAIDQRLEQPNERTSDDPGHSTY